MTLRLEISQLSCERSQQVLFSGFDLELISGQGLLIYGANGCGKTTLLRTIAGLHTPLAGDIIWNHQSIYQSISLYHQTAHFLGHAYGIKNQLTVRENILYSQSLNHPQTQKNVDSVIKKVSLQAQQSSLSSRLSAGQKRRLALARLFAVEKPLWILDEPFTNLDKTGQQWFSEALEAHLSQGGITIITSHQPLNIRHLRTIELAGEVQ